MKYGLKRLALLSVTFACTSIAAADADVTVNVSGVSATQGKLVLTIFDSKKGWLKKPMMTDSLVVEGESATFEVRLPPGRYAFHVYHDLDDNGKMKSNFIGIPREPTAVSNEAKGRFGPPKFKDAAVAIGDDPVSVPMKLVSID